MIFSEKLEQIFKLLQISNVKLSYASKLDSSVISRYRNGERVPRPNSPQYHKLINGIELLAEETGNVTELFNLCSIDNIGDNKLIDALNIWLISDEFSDKHLQYKNGSSKVSPEQFSTRFSAIMSLLEISNIRLAKFLNVDASLISRYRNGLRAPVNDSQIAPNICTYFINRAEVQQQIDSLRTLCGANVNMDLNNAIYDYLYSCTKKSSYESVDIFLNKMDTISMSSELELPLFQTIATPDVMADKSCYYQGSNGLRSAVKRFLCQIVEQPLTHELLLYSDQNMEWLSGNQEFTQLWTYLMIMVLNKKIKIKIIHNFNRNLEEMFEGITKWLPLYLSGLITPYYNKNKEESQFSHTMFIDKNVGAIAGSFVKGTEFSAVYHYITEKRLLENQVVQYKNLIQKATQFLNVYNQNNKMEYLDQLNKIIAENVDMSLLSQSPSVMTLPKELLQRILERNMLPKDKCMEIISYQKTLSEGFLQTLTTNKVFELINMPSSEDIATGKVEIGISGFLIDTPIYYTEEEFSLHKISIDKLLELHSNYHFIPLDRNSLNNVQILSKKGTSIIISKTGSSAVAFAFNSPQIREAFEQYLHFFCSQKF